MVYFGSYYFATDQEKPFCAWIYDLWTCVEAIVSASPMDYSSFFFQNALMSLEVFLGLESGSLEASNHL